MSQYILRDGFAGLFTLAEWGRKGDMPVNVGYDKTTAALYYMKFNLYTLGGPLLPSDVMNPHLPAAEVPHVIVWAAAGQEGAASGKGPRNVYRAGTFQGRDLMAWSAFLDLFRATGADQKAEGPAVPLVAVSADGKTGGLHKLAMRVGALEGRGQYEPKNVLRAWHTDMAKFTAEDAAARAAFDAALAAAPAGMLDAAQGARPAETSAPTMTLGAAAVAPSTPPAPTMTLGAAATPAQGAAEPATGQESKPAAEGAPATPRKRRTKAEIQAAKEEAERAAAALAAEERETAAEEERARSGGQ